MEEKVNELLFRSKQQIWVEEKEMIGRGGGYRDIYGHAVEPTTRDGG